jgi:23S rRNA (cytosine1962-C5)-methyltransferase
MTRINLKPDREESLLRFHPWIFSGAIKNMDGVPVAGDLVEVYSSRGDFLAAGHYQSSASIAVRVLTFAQQAIDRDFWKNRLLNAYCLRQAAGLTDSSHTDTYRLVHGEGDGLPGLIIDIYHRTAVIQAHCTGMFLRRQLFTELLREIYGDRLVAVYDKSAATLHCREEAEIIDGYLFGDKQEKNFLREYDNIFEADWEGGQKTGFFIDQRESRRLVQQYASGRTVLNMFGYTGAFSVYALRGGAKNACTVDSSRRAVEAADRNVALNFSDAKHESQVADCFNFLKNMDNPYDMVIVDPPAFAKNHHAVKNALQAYKRLNVGAINAVKPRGICFTFSCSQAVSREQFRSAIFAAAAVTGRKLRIIHQLTQPSDHPVNIFHPEGEYLKGLVLYVE